MLCLDEPVAVYHKKIVLCAHYLFRGFSGYGDVRHWASIPDLLPILNFLKFQGVARFAMICAMHAPVWSKGVDASNHLRQSQLTLCTASNCCRQSQLTFRTHLIPTRHSILIENLGETLEAVLTPVIQRAVIYRGRKMYIKLGDSEVEFHPEFRSVPITILTNFWVATPCWVLTELWSLICCTAGFDLCQLFGKRRLPTPLGLIPLSSWASDAFLHCWLRFILGQATPSYPRSLYQLLGMHL